MAGLGARVGRAGAVGLYVPGGTAVLPSTTLMLAVPAALAGCGTVVMATPPRPDGTVTPEVAYCARKAGVTHVLKAGGAQAVAALAWGTATCPKVTMRLVLARKFCLDMEFGIVKGACGRFECAQGLAAFRRSPPGLGHCHLPQGDSRIWGMAGKFA